MDRPPLRYLAIPIAVLAAFVSLVYVYFGTEFGWELEVLRWFAIGSLVAGLPFAALREGRRRLYTFLVVAGIVVFYAGAPGGACNAMAYPDSADHGLTYDLSENVLRFGDNIDGAQYRCGTVPIRPFWLLGYGLTSVGLIGLVSQRRDGTQ